MKTDARCKMLTLIIALTGGACADGSALERSLSECAEDEPACTDDASSLLPQTAGVPEPTGVPSGEGVTLDGRRRFSNDCGYPYATTFVARSGDRVLSAGSGRWMLFDAQSGATIASGPTSRRAWSVLQGMVALEGNVALVPTIVEVGGVMQHDGLVLLDARDGHVQGLITADLPQPPVDGGLANRAQAGLARDGSYAWLADDRALTVWSPSGQQLSKVFGSYYRAQFFAAPEAIYTLLAPHGQVVQVASGSVQNVPETPLFPSASVPYRRWFEDGRYYFDSIDMGDHLALYSLSRALVQEVGPTPGMRFSFAGGSGQFYWGTAVGTGMQLYRVAGPLTVDMRPVPIPGIFKSQSGTPLAGHGSILLTEASGKNAQVVDLRGEEPAVVALAQVPTAYRESTASVSAFGSDSALRIALTKGGVVYASEAGPETKIHALGCRAP